MKAACFLAVLGIFCFAGCSTPGSQYVRAHPELSAAHREILTTGTIPGGGAVEGMTKEQVISAIGPPESMQATKDMETLYYVEERPWWQWVRLQVRIKDGKVTDFGEAR